MNDSCPRCERIEKWLDHVGCSPNKSKRYEILLSFVKSLTKRSCCNVCECMSCDALEVLRNIKEDK
jgi:hypothetical protein